MRRAWIVLLLAWMPLASAAPLFAGESADLAQEVALAAKEGKRLAVVIEREDCQYCERMRRNVFPTRAAQRQFGAWFRTAAVRADKDSALIAPDGTRTTPAAFAERLHLVGTPAFVFFDGEGKLETRYQGAFNDADGLNALGAYVRGRAYESLPFPTWRAQRAGTKKSSVVPVLEGDICTTRPHGA